MRSSKRLLPLAMLAALGLASPAGCGGRRLGDRDSGLAATDASSSAGSDATAPADGGGGGSGELAVATWNIEQFPGAPNTIGDVAVLIEDLGLDLVGVQEVADPSGFDELVATMPGWDGRYAPEGDGFIRVALLWRTAVIQASEFELLFASNSWAFPRPPYKARIVADDGTGSPFDFVVIVVHLKALGDDESEERRRLAVAALHDWVASQIASGTEDDFVLLGDWNDELTDGAASNVFLPFLDHDASYAFLTLPLEEAGESSYIPFSSFIDHVLVTSGALGEYGAGETSVVRLDDTFPGYLDTISDHRPVRAIFRAPF